MCYFVVIRSTINSHNVMILPNAVNGRCPSLPQGFKRPNSNDQIITLTTSCVVSYAYATLPVSASPEIWLSPRGHVDSNSLGNDPSVCNFCNFSLTLFTETACIWPARFTVGFRCYIRTPPADTITRISIRTAGLAFGGTGLCTYRVRGVDGSCAEHLTVESYTVFICQLSHLLLLGIPSPTHSFIPGLKPSFSANPSHRGPSFFFFGIHHMDSPDCLLLFLNISVFYF